MTEKFNPRKKVPIEIDLKFTEEKLHKLKSDYAEIEKILKTYGVDLNNLDKKIEYTKPEYTKDVEELIPRLIILKEKIKKWEEKSISTKN